MSLVPPMPKELSAAVVRGRRGLCKPGNGAGVTASGKAKAGFYPTAPPNS
jgi:hypothetical protein